MATNSKQKKSSGLALHASTVALSPARSLTSHARKRYYERYSGRYRHAPFVFAFDVFLLGVLASLLVLNLFWLIQASFLTNAGLDLSFVAPPLRGSDVVPVLAAVRATDHREHDDVQLRWQLPEWVEVVQADPPIRKDGTIFFGRVLPGDVRQSRLLVHIRAPKDAQVPFAFTLQQFDPLGLNRNLVGSETRTVAASTLSIKPAVSSTKIVSGASIPFIVTNSGTTSTEGVSVRLVQEDGAPNAGFEGRTTLTLDTLTPNEDRVVFLDVGNTNAPAVNLSWELLDGSQAIESQSGKYDVAPDIPFVVNNITANPYSMNIEYHNSTPSSELFIAHPKIAIGASEFRSWITYPADLGGRTQGMSVLDQPTPITRWSVVPIAGKEADGIIGRRVVGSVTKRFPLRADAHYYSSAGDQIGVGPNPPKVGETTTYWIVWTVGPGDYDLKNLVLSTTLNQGVHATGKFASSANGTFSSAGGNVTWSIPSLKLAGAETQTFAFEIAFTPERWMSLKDYAFTGNTDGRAVDAKTGDSITAVAGPPDTRLQHDLKK